MNAIRSASPQTPDAVFDVLRRLRDEGKRAVIDLPAINPFSDEDLSNLTSLMSIIKAEPILVLSAEGHPEDQAEAARAFARAGIRRAILTKLDVVRRRGGVISALSAAHISISRILRSHRSLVVASSRRRPRAWPRFLWKMRPEM